MGSGMIIGIALIVFVLVVALWAISTYNILVRLRNMNQEAWSGVDVQLKRRHDLVGNLVNAVKGYMAHEKEVLEKIAEFRSAASGVKTVGEAGQIESGLGQALGRLFAVMENYPDLKADKNVMHLQTQLAELEDEIQMARRYYNGSVRELNTKIEMFPSNIIANMFNFIKAEFFELDNVEERKAPTVTF